jgi:hypothetical protein
MDTIFADELTPECIEQCESQGVGDAVTHWVREGTVAAVIGRLFPPDVRRHLRAFGSWSEAELADDVANRRRLLWAACRAFRGGDDFFVV